MKASIPLNYSSYPGQDLLDANTIYIDSNPSEKVVFIAKLLWSCVTKIIKYDTLQRNIHISLPYI